MNIIITGGLGHIGSYFIDNISRIKSLKKIVILDNNSNNRINNLFFNKRKVHLIICDLTDEKFIKKINFNTDIILHLASITDAEASVKNKKKVIFNNLTSFKNIIKLAKIKKSKLIHISSTSVYGSSESIVDEMCRKLKPQSPYADIKLKEEKILMKEKNINYITLRFATIVGFSKGMRFHTAVNKFCFNTIFNIAIPVWKFAIDKFRPYLSLEDSFRVFKAIIENKIFDKRIHNVISNNYTVKDIIKKIRKYKKNIKVNYVNSRIMNQLSYKVINKTGLLKKIKLKNEIDSEIKKIFLSFKSIS
jgi:UDP-glucose 4-epimerase